MTGRGRRFAAVIFSGALLTLICAAPAVAADEISIDHVESANGVVSMVVSVDGIPGDSVSSKDVGVQIDGKGVDAKVKSVAAGDGARSTILVVDASNSMRGAKFKAATDAVTAFLASAPPDVMVGMVAFAGDVGTSLAPTPDRSALLEAFTQLELAPGTGVYDAVAEAITLAGTDGSRSLLLLSDGADTGSTTTLAEVADTAADNEIVIDVVAIGSAAKTDALASLADATNGQVIPADPDVLGQVFADQASALAQQLLVSFEPAAEVGGEADITVTVDGVGTTYSDSAFVSLKKPSRSPNVGPASTIVEKPLIGTPLMLAGATALFLGLAALAWAAISGATGRTSAIDKRLDDYFAANDGKVPAPKRSANATGVKESAVALADRMVSANLETRIAQRLAGAGSALTAAEWVLLHVAVALGSATLFFFLLGGAMAVLGLVLGLVLPWMYLKRRHTKRRNAFNGQLAETLGLMAGGLQAGLAFPQAVDTVVREGNEPMAGELRRALVEQRLGVEITDSLESVAERMESDDFGWVVMAIRIQREVGGNLAEILHTVADTLREREYLRRQVKSLSAEGRLSGYILTALPPLIIIYMYVVNPDYIAILWTTGMGWVLMTIAAALLSIGGWAMSKMSKVEV